MVFRFFFSFYRSCGYDNLSPYPNYRRKFTNQTFLKSKLGSGVKVHYLHIFCNSTLFDTIIFAFIYLWIGRWEQCVCTCRSLVGTNDWKNWDYIGSHWALTELGSLLGQSAVRGPLLRISGITPWYEYFAQDILLIVCFFVVKIDWYKISVKPAPLLLDPLLSKISGPFSVTTL